MLGTDLVAELNSGGHEVWAPVRDEIDVTDPSSVAQIATGEFAADWCFNCAAYTAVDLAESEVQLATELNALAPGYIAQACAMRGVRVMHLSTDFVFDGEAVAPYREDEATHPLGVYGETKRRGEESVLAASPNSVVVRTAWLYGPAGRSFPRTMVRAWLAGKPLRVVTDQVGCPTYTADLATTIVNLAVSVKDGGIYHACGPEVMNWYDFASRTLQSFATASGNSAAIEIAPIESAEYPTPAERPKYSVLDNAKIRALGVEPMRPVDDAIRDFCARLIVLYGSANVY